MGHLHSSIITMCFKLVHSKIARANGNGLIVSVSKPLLLLCLKLCLMLFVLSLPKLNFGSFHKYPPTNKIFISLIKIVCPAGISLMTTFLDFFYQEKKTFKWKNFSRTIAPIWTCSSFVIWVVYKNECFF